MSVYFVDTSALAKRYIAEVGSAWMRSLAHPIAGHTIVISRLTTVEFVSALARRQRENSITTADFVMLRGAFIKHTERHYRVINLHKAVLAEARDLVVRYPLRALDAVQLACALTAARGLSVYPIFLSADPRLLTAVTTEGFTVDDPNTHP